MDKAYDYFSAETRDALESLPEDLLIFLCRGGQVSCILATRHLTNEIHVNFQDIFKFYQEHPFDILHPDDKATFNGQVAQRPIRARATSSGSVCACLRRIRSSI